MVERNGQFSTMFQGQNIRNIYQNNIFCTTPNRSISFGVNLNPDLQDVEKSSSLLLFNLFPEFFPTWQTEANFDPELFLPQVVSHMLNVLPNSVGLALERKENVFFFS